MNGWLEIQIPGKKIDLVKIKIINLVLYVRNLLIPAEASDSFLIHCNQFPFCLEADSIQKMKKIDNRQSGHASNINNQVTNFSFTHRVNI